MLDFFLSALSPVNLLLALLGVAAGTIIGSIPGLTATMAVAVLVPITFAMPPDSALILLGAIYTGAIYGGAYAAILLNTPGTPSAIATTFDGYPMARRGDGDLAVTIACLASVCGGLVGALALLLFAPPLAEAALAFGPVEYFWLAIFGLSLIAALSTGSFLKGAIGAGFGLLLSTIGISETSAEVRFTFGSTTLLGGIEVVSALIGLYCIPVLIDLVASPDKHIEGTAGTRGFRLAESMATLMRNKFNVIRSSIIGTLVGALPGAGGSIAGLVAYSEARRSGEAKRARQIKRAAKDDTTSDADHGPNKNQQTQSEEKYGEGNPGGIIATESANNATVGGGFIPTLVLGIPGTPPDAVILGALLVQGVRTGPSLFAEGSVVYTFIFGLLLATILMLPTGLLIGRFAYNAIARAPKAALVPVVAFMTVIGAFAIRNSLSDVAIMIILGVIGWIATRRGFSVSPIVLGLILGRIAEQGFVQSWTIGDAIGDLPGQFFGRPLSQAIIVLTVISFLYPFWPQIRRIFVGKEPDQATATPKGTGGATVGMEVISIGAFAVVAATALYLSGSLNAEAAVFPRTIAQGTLVLCALAIIYALLFRQGEPLKPIDGPVRRLLVPVSMLAAVALIPLLGFTVAGMAMGLVLLLTAQHERFSPRGWTLLIGAVLATTALFVFAFREALNVPLPSGAFF